MAQSMRWTAFVVVVLLLSATLAGCSGSQGGADAQGHAVAMAEIHAMPQQVQVAPKVVRDAYRFAAANPDVLRQIPCYCGCGGMGHMSNYHCFWQDNRQEDTHALGCGICVDIAQDVNRGLARGLSVVEIRAQVDADYSRFGPPTNTQLVDAMTQ